MDRSSVVCIGQACADILVKSVDPEIQNRGLTVVEEISYAAGGDAMNEAVTLARLGLPVKLMTSVGTDVWGDFIITSGKEAGVDMGCVKHSSDYPTTLTIVLIRQDGEHCFVCNDGTTMHFSMESLDMPSIEKAKVVSLASMYLTYETDQAFLAAAKAGKKNGAIITVDTMINPAAKSLDSQAELLPLVDFIFPSYSEACHITGEKDPGRIADFFLKRGVKNVVIKTGKTGCYIQNADEKFTVPTYKNAKPIDTTGAGDNFAAGFIYGLTRNLSIRECAAYANAAASVSIQYVGAGGARSIKEVEDMMAGGILEI